MVGNKARELVQQLKTVRREKGMSYQYIADQCEARGKPVSISTIKRVFATTAAAEFRYETTLQPIAEVVLGIKEETPEPDPKKADEQLQLYYTEIEAMKNSLQLKGDLIQTKDKIIADKDAEIAFLRGETQRKDRWIGRLAAAVAILAAIIIIALIIDYTYSHIGFFWVNTP